MAKPWMETWDPKADCTTNGQRIWTIYDRAREDADGTYEVATVEHDDEPAARLVAAAPAMARALCLLERGTVMLPSESGGASSPIGGSSLPDGGGAVACAPPTGGCTDDGCPSFPEHYGTEGCCGCGEETPADDRVVHAPNCPLDAALTEAGLTAEDREAVRKAGK